MSRAGVWMRAAARWIADRRLVLAAGLLAALPVIVSAVRALAVGWVPLGDDAIIAVRAYDVLSTHPPLLGQFSASSGVTGASAHSLGPMLYWLLAVPARLGPPALVITVALVNVASIVGAVGLAHRRGGFALTLVTAVAFALMCASLVPDTLHSVWNPSAALLPFTLLIFVAWSLACGEHRLLPLAVLLASFALQCHLTYVLPVTGLLAVGLGGLLLDRGARERPEVRRWALAALAVGLVCWSAPLLEQAIHRPGNFVSVARVGASQDEKMGIGIAWHTAVRAVGMAPWWLRDPRAQEQTLHDIEDTPGPLAIGSALLILAGLLTCAVAALRRGRHDVAAAGAIALLLCAALGAVAGSTPSGGGLGVSVGYTLRWGSPAGMFIWLALGWSVVALRPAWRRREIRPRLAFAGLVLTALVAGVVAAGTPPDLLEGRYESGATVIGALEDLPGESPVSVDAPLNRFDLHAAAVYALRRRGEGVFADLLVPQLGGEYTPDAGSGTDVVQIGGDAQITGGQVIARVADIPIGAQPPYPTERTVTVTRSAAGAPAP